MSEAGKRLILVDGYGFVFRAYHSLPPLTRSDGTPVGAVLGFCNMLLKLLQDHSADNIVVVLDAGAKTFRNDLYDQYKANRPPAPEDLIPQFPLIREASEAMHLLTVDKPGYEADDIIATYTRQAVERGMEVTIVSSDKDLMQLVGDSVSMFDAMKSRKVGVLEVEEKFGVEPGRVLDVLSLMGDSSDNVPGIPGIGPKTAAQLIQEYGSLDGLLARASEVKQNKRRENLINHADEARLSRDLIRLCDTVEGIPDLADSAVRDIDPNVLLGFLEINGFKNLIARVTKLLGTQGDFFAERGGADVESGSKSTPEPVISVSTEVITDIAALDAVVEQVLAVGQVGIQLVSDACVVGMMLGLPDGKHYYVPLTTETVGDQTNLFDATEADGVSDGLLVDEVYARLLPIWSARSVLKIGCDIKSWMVAFSDVGIAPYEDVQLLSYVLSGGKYKHVLDTLCVAYLEQEPASLEALTGKGKAALSFAEVDRDALVAVLAGRGAMLFRLQRYLRRSVREEGLLSVYETIERPLIRVLAQMEIAGVGLNGAYLDALSSEFEARLGVLESEIHVLAHKEFNVGSPKQLGEVLFDDLGLLLTDDKKPKKSKTGAYVTGAEVLEELAALGHRIAVLVLEWRQLSKLKSTYTDALVKQVDAKTGRVHTHFSMASTSTGRLSSNDPNLQNIPIRSEEGYKIREAFVAASGCQLVSADYSQVELRLLAHMADISVLKEAFKAGDDIHALTASQVFGVPVEGMDPMVRRQAKAINFGIIYGLSAFGLAKQLGISRTDAGRYIDAYFERYPGIRRFMEEKKQFAKERGYVETLFGRRCYLEGIHASNPMQRNFAERAAINAPLQGTAADIIKLAMVQLEARFMSEGLSARMLLQVHDELLVEAPHSEVSQVTKIVEQVMRSAVSLSVPLLVELGVGDNWRQTH